MLYAECNINKNGWTTTTAEIYIYIYLELLFLGEKWINYIHIQHEIPIPLWNDSRVCKCTVHKEMNVCVHRFEIHTIWKILGGALPLAHIIPCSTSKSGRQREREREREREKDDTRTAHPIYPSIRQSPGRRTTERKAKANQYVLAAEGFARPGRR